MSSNLSGVIESLLFAAGEPLQRSQIAEILDITEKEVINEIEKISTFYQAHQRGFKIIELEDEYQLCTVEDYFPYIQCITQPKRKQNLSPAALETLSIVAYNQPVTRSSIEYIRGVNSDGPINKLIERGLIEENGRLDAPGRPILYVTTQEFLRSFGLKSLSSLPDVEQFGTSINAENDDDNEEYEQILLK